MWKLKDVFERHCLFWFVSEISIIKLKLEILNTQLHPWCLIFADCAYFPNGFFFNLFFHFLSKKNASRNREIFWLSKIEFPVFISFFCAFLTNYTLIYEFRLLLFLVKPKQKIAITETIKTKEVAMEMNWFYWSTCFFLIFYEIYLCPKKKFLVLFFYHWDNPYWIA